MRPAALSLASPLEGAVARLVCFPHAGGAASAFRSLKQALAPHGIEVCPLQAPGRENRYKEANLETAEDLVAEFSAALVTLPPLPTSYLGHSLGGLIAYLTARILPPVLLVASGSAAPCTRRAEISTHQLPRDEFREKVFAMGGVPEAIRNAPALFDMFEGSLRADYRISDTYQHQDCAPLACPVAVYAGRQDRAVSEEGLRGWQALSRSPVRLRHFDGGHFFLYQHPDSVSAALREDIGC